MHFHLDGELHEIGDVQQTSPSFSIRNFVLKYEDGTFHEYASFTIKNSFYPNMLVGLKVGDKVRVGFKIIGKSFKTNSGDKRMSNDLYPFFVEKLKTI